MSFTGFPSDERGGELRGVAVAIVTDNDDPEEMGRVKLTYPWRDADDKSDWARIAMPMAGPDQGTYFLPDVDDEVLVAFENNDIHHPIVIGALWNGEQKPPATNQNGKNDIRKITSRTGHEIVFDDAEGGGKVELSTKAGHSVVLDDTSGSEAVTVEDKNGQQIAFDANQGTIDVKGNTKVSVSAPTIELKGDGNISIETSGMLTLKGSLVNIN
jgi:uncharacterized protein involved in type VI secretion and phage assembly